MKMNTKKLRDLRWDYSVEQDDKEIEKLAIIFKALAHPSRIKIIKYLMEKGDLIISDIQQRLEFKGYTYLKPHLDTLKNIGIISLTKKKQNNRTVVSVHLKVSIKEIIFTIEED